METFELSTRKFLIIKNLEENGVILGKSKASCII